MYSNALGFKEKTEREEYRDRGRGRAREGKGKEKQRVLKHILIAMLILRGII